jgi:hypothetical protein
MKKILFALLGIFSLALSGHAEEKEPFMIYVTPKVADKFDAASMDSPELWEKAQESSNFKLFSSNSEKEPEAGTIFLAAYNAKGLFVRLECSENNCEKIDFTFAPGTRDVKTFDKPLVEVFLDPAFTRSIAAQFAVNTSGGVYDAWGKGNSPWNHDLERKIVPWQNKKGYTIFILFSWKDIGADNPDSGPLFTMTPEVNSIIGFNAARERIVGNGELSQWKRTSKMFFKPNEFGALILSGEEGVIEKALKLFNNQIIGDGIAINGGIPEWNENFLRAFLADKFASAKMLTTSSSEEIRKKYASSLEELEKQLPKAKSVNSLQSLLNSLTALESGISKEAFEVMKQQIFDAI